MPNQFIKLTDSEPYYKFVKCPHCRKGFVQKECVQIIPIESLLKEQRGTKDKSTSETLEQARNNL